MSLLNPTAWMKAHRQLKFSSHSTPLQLVDVSIRRHGLPRHQTWRPAHSLEIGTSPAADLETRACWRWVRRRGDFRCTDIRLMGRHPSTRAWRKAWSTSKPQRQVSPIYRSGQEEVRQPRPVRLQQPGERLGTPTPRPWRQVSPLDRSRQRREVQP